MPADVYSQQFDRQGVGRQSGSKCGFLFIRNRTAAFPVTA
jgi:hypothetical protein